MSASGNIKLKPRQEQLLRRLISELEKGIPGLVAAYRFGSWGTTAERADSDIDLAILAPAPLESVRRWELAERLAMIAGRNVDLVDLGTASAVMRAQVIASGARVFCADEPRCAEFEDSFIPTTRASTRNGVRFSLTSANGAVSMTDDVVLNKCAIIERCLRRLDEEYRGHEPELEKNLLRQDSIILNLQRACEAAIDLAMHLVRVHRLGLP